MTDYERIIGAEILRKLPYEPNTQQMELVAALSRFAASADDRSVFLLNGYAGTGKTSLSGAFVNALPALRRRAVLLAPTQAGRRRCLPPIPATVHSRFIARFTKVTGSIRKW